MRHDEPKNLFARLSAEVHNDVEVEPPLLPLSGEILHLGSANRRDDARSDVRVRSFWRKQQCAFFEFRVFYPFAQSHSNKAPAALFKSVEGERKRQYLQRIRDVDNGSFTPMVMSSTGAIGPEMDQAIKALAHKLADKRKEVHSVVVGTVRARFVFAAVRSALICLRGSRSRWSSGRLERVLHERAAIVARDARIDF